MQGMSGKYFHVERSCAFLIEVAGLLVVEDYMFKADLISEGFWLKTMIVKAHSAFLLLNIFDRPQTKHKEFLGNWNSMCFWEATFVLGVLFME